MNIDELKWHKFPVLDDGFVCLVDHMGSDAAVVQAARVSYGKDVRSEFPPDDDKLLRFLMRMHHTTPFEMCEVKLLVRCPMDVWRQWIRHRTASVNEYSTRYTTAIDSAQKTKPEDWRLQSKSNKQGSSGMLIHCAEGQPGAENAYRLTDAEGDLQRRARAIYEERLECGVASEQARKDLPLSTYTEAYWKIDLHNLLHFLGKRMDPAAQLEIRQYACIIGEQIVAKLFPATWQAFLDYRLNAMTLSAMEVELLGDMMRDFGLSMNALSQALIPSRLDPKRELDQFRAKLERMITSSSVH